MGASLEALGAPSPGLPLSLWDVWPALTSGVLSLAVPTAKAAAVAALTLLAARWARDLVRRSLKRTRADASVNLLLGRLAYFAVLTVGVLWVLAIYEVGLTAIAATLGVATLAVSLSLQDVLKNLVAGLYLLVERPFRLGERLSVRTFEGVVESVDVRTTTLRMPTGERVVIPNAILFAEVLVNRGLPPEVSDIGQAEEAPGDAPRSPAAG